MYQPVRRDEDHSLEPLWDEEMQPSINQLDNQCKMQECWQNTIIVENWDNWLRSVEQGPPRAKLRVLATLE